MIYLASNSFFLNLVLFYTALPYIVCYMCYILNSVIAESASIIMFLFFFTGYLLPKIVLRL